MRHGRSQTTALLSIEKLMAKQQLDKHIKNVHKNTLSLQSADLSSKKPKFVIYPPMNVILYFLPSRFHLSCLLQVSLVNNLDLAISLLRSDQFCALDSACNASTSRNMIPEIGISESLSGFWNGSD